MLITSVHLGSNCWLSKYWNRQLCSLVHIPPKDCQSICQHDWVLVLLVTMPRQVPSGLKTSLAALFKSIKGWLQPIFLLASEFLQFLFLQPQGGEKSQNISPETKQRLCPMMGYSPSLDTRTPKESTFHNLNYVFTFCSLTSLWASSCQSLRPSQTLSFHIFHSWLYRSMYRSHQRCPCQSHERWLAFFLKKS